MIGLLVCLLLGAAWRTEAARAPKIYNALITSDENLAPSQAYPLVEPVVRTTSVGVAPLFQPLLVHRSPAPAPDDSRGDEGNEPTQAQISHHDAYPLYPVSYDPYFQYGYHQSFVYSPPLPYYQQPVYVDYGHGLAPTRQAESPQQESPKTPTLPVLPPSSPAAASHAHFQKNPDVPDVIPPLPSALRKAAKQKRLVMKQ